MKVKILVVQEDAKASDILSHVKNMYPLEGLNEYYNKGLYEIRVSTGIRVLVIYNGSPNYDMLRGQSSEYPCELLDITDAELDDELKKMIMYVCRTPQLSEQRYLDKKNRLKIELDKNLRVLDMQFTHSRRRFKVGDKIVNHIGSCIQIESIGTVAPNTFYNSQNVPLVSYRGIRLTKKLLPYKDAGKLHFTDNAHEALKVIS
jgi:hypothetical protein